MDFAALIPRGIFHDNGGGHHVNRTCPVPNESGPEIVPIVGTFTFHHLNVIIAGAMTAFACLLAFALIMLHATHYSSPPQQKQIIRITFTIPVFSAVSLITIAAQSKWVYLSPLTDLYEALALAGFFLLLCNYVSPNEDERMQKLASVGKLGLFHRVWLFAFQQPVVMLILLIVTEITEATGDYCATSNKVQFAHVWTSAIKFISSIMAIMGILRFYGGTKSMTHEQRPLIKLIAFKLMIALQVLQTLVFSYLTSSGHLHANDHLTFNDLSVGIRNLMICAEMVIFSILFWFAYPVGPYLTKNITSHATSTGHVGYVGGFLGIKALFSAINVIDLLLGIVKAPSMFSRGREIQRYENSNSGGGGGMMGKGPARPKYENYEV